MARPDVIIPDVKNLRKLRKDPEAIKAVETRLLRAMTVEQSVRAYLDLQREFEPFLQETEPFFRQGRNLALIQLQARLLRLNHLNGKTMQNLMTSLASLQERLERESIPSIAIGGLAVGFWGQPRMTRDVDLKVLIKRRERARLLNLLSDFTALNADPDEALRRNGIAFFQDPSGTRIDILLAETDFDETAIGRAMIVALEPGLHVRVCTPEDLIIYKLVSLRAQDAVDVEGIVQRQRDALDDNYVEKWLSEFERALDDSTLVSGYRRLREKYS